MVVVIVFVLLKFFDKYAEVVVVAVVDVDVVVIVDVVVVAEEAAIRFEFDMIVVVFPQ